MLQGVRTPMPSLLASAGVPTMLQLATVLGGTPQACTTIPMERWLRCHLLDGLWILHNLLAHIIHHVTMLQQAASLPSVGLQMESMFGFMPQSIPRAVNHVRSAYPCTAGAAHTAVVGLALPVSNQFRHHHQASMAQTMHLWLSKLFFYSLRWRRRTNHA